MSPTLFHEGGLADLPPEVRAHLLGRTPADQPELAERVAGIVADVRARGDEALLEMARRWDGVELERLEVPPRLWDDALDALDDDVAAALRRAAANIRRFHEAQRPTDTTVEVAPGIRVTRRWTPLGAVGVYAPGGRAAYPSSVLMGAVPAVAAGVGEVVVCSPPGPSGLPPAEVLAACRIAGATRLFALGGAGAVAALAFGTGSVPRVDGIVGPGNRWVTEAKRQLAGRVVIDAPAGPSEVLVLADGTAPVERIAAELLAQAEHDPEAACVAVLVGPGAPALRSVVAAAVERRLAEAARREIAREALAAHGAVLSTESLDDAVAFVEAYAPEHLSVMTREPVWVAGRISTAGTIFVGPRASVAFGDYLTGANHVLPTGGRARSFSGLSTAHYLRAYTVQEIDGAGARSLVEDTVLLAEAEGLPAHAAAARESAAEDADAP